MSTQSLTIGKLAQVTGVHVETIRYYQRRGLMRIPPRPLKGIRRYDDSDVRRLAFIRHAQQLGFSLEEVTQLLKLEDGTHCAEAQAIAEEKMEAVRQRIAGLRQVETVLAELVNRCGREGGDQCCPLIDALHDIEATDPPESDH